MADKTSTTTIVFITDANQGIGFAIAHALSNLALHPDHQVIIGSRSLEKGEFVVEALMGEEPTRCLSTVSINVTSDASIEAAVAAILERYGHIDVPINNAVASLGTKALREHPSCSSDIPTYRCSKAAVNMLMLHYASVYEKRGWKIDAADPGLMRASLGGEVMAAIMASDAAGRVWVAAKEVCRWRLWGPMAKTGLILPKSMSSRGSVVEDYMA